MQLYVDFDRPLGEEELAPLRELLTRRSDGEPLQHLLGKVAFAGHDFRCDSRGLIPRPETERVWEEAVLSLHEAGPGTVIVDLGTGSGVLALALKHAFPRARVYGIDLSEVIAGRLPPKQEAGMSRSIRTALPFR